MASINNLEVKGVKYFPDHEGAMIPYGNLYFKGKRVGSFRTDSWGGQMMYDHTHKTITVKEIDEALYGIVTKLGWHDFYKSTEILINELIMLKELESKFKKVSKNDKFLMVFQEDHYLDPMKQINNIGPLTVYEVSNTATKKDIDGLIEEIIEDKGKGYGAVTVYRSLDDFIL